MIDQHDIDQHDHDSDPAEPRVSVVVTTYRRRERCERLLGALEAQTLPPHQFEVIVVDDGSPDGTAEMLKTWSKQTPFRLRPLILEHNQGQGRARNMAIQHARSPFLAFTDDDCLPQPRWLESGLQALESDPTVGVVQGCTTQPHDFTGEGLPRWHHRQNILGATPFLEACNVFYRREAVLAAGGFDEAIGRWGEDVALGWSVLERGWSRSFAADALAIHDVELRGWLWYVKTGFMEQNLMRIAARHPMFRRQVFWRPWAYRSRDAAFVLAVGSALSAIWKPYLIAGVLPYAWIARESPRQKGFLLYCLQIVGVDAARSAGHLAGALRNRILVI